MPAFAGHTTGQADFPHPALGQDFTLARATPSAASEHLSELIGFPISRSFTTYCVCLELRSLPSTGVTRLQRYYEPLRHPRAPSLSLTGLRLVIADHALGPPVFRALSLCTCRRQYPGVVAGRNLRSTRPAISAFPDMAVGSLRMPRQHLQYWNLKTHANAPSPRRLCNTEPRSLGPEALWASGHKQ